MACHPQEERHVMAQRSKTPTAQRVAEPENGPILPPTPTIPLSGIKDENRWFLLIFILIIVSTIAAYSQLPLNHFVLYDDPEYITDNSNILGGLTFKGVLWAFSEIYQGNWHPLTWVSHMLDVQLFGLNPVGHHATSLLLHLGNALFLFVILRKMTGALWQSAAVALFFALHPLHVESVAWAAERKDLLCALLWLLTMRGYLWYTERPGWCRYLLLLAVFTAGLMSKAMIVTLPCALFLLDFWPLGRIDLGSGFRRLLVCIGEKVPLLLLSAVVSVVTFRAQILDTPISHHTPLLYNVSNALQAYVGYLAKTFWPVDLAVAYPYDIARFTPWRSAGAALILLVITFGVVREWRRRPYLLTGWLWYLFTLVPVVGFVKIGIMSMADRYTYIPLIGIFIMVSWGSADLVARSTRARRLLAVTAVAVMLTLTFLTAHQVRYWQNGITLMEHAVAVTDNNWFALNNLGAAYLLVGTTARTLNITASLPLYPATTERREAYQRKTVVVCKEALRISPSFPMAHFNLGAAYLSLGDREAALAEYRILLSLDLALANNLWYWLD